MEFTYLVFTGIPGESYRRQLRSLLLYLCYVLRALINSLVCWTNILIGCYLCLNDISMDFIFIAPGYILYSETMLFFVVLAESGEDSASPLRAQATSQGPGGRLRRVASAPCHPYRTPQNKGVDAGLQRQGHFVLLGRRADAFTSGGMERAKRRRLRPQPAGEASHACSERGKQRGSLGWGRDHQHFGPKG